MVLGNCIFFYVLYGCGKPWAGVRNSDASESNSSSVSAAKLRNNGRKKALTQWSSSLSAWLVLCFVCALAMFKVALYVIYKNYACFFFAYGSGVIGVVATSVTLINYPPFVKRNSPSLRWNHESNRRLCTTLVSIGLFYYGAAFVVWSVENAFCTRSTSYPNLFKDNTVDSTIATVTPDGKPTLDEVLRNDPSGWQLQKFFRVAKLHVFWHYGASLGTYSYVLHLAVYHCDWLGWRCALRSASLGWPRIVAVRGGAPAKGD